MHPHRKLAQLDNRRLNYGDFFLIKICDPSAILDFKLSGFQSLRSLREPIMYMHTKFQPNPTIRGLVISGERESRIRQCFSEVSEWAKLHQTSCGSVIEDSVSFQGDFVRPVSHSCGINELYQLWGGGQVNHRRSYRIY